MAPLREADEKGKGSSTSTTLYRRLGIPSENGAFDQNKAFKGGEDDRVKGIKR